MEACAAPGNNLRKYIIPVVGEIGGDANKCSHCPSVFSSRQALAAHLCAVHGERHILRKYVDTEHCAFCLQLFSSRECLIRHLHEKSAGCKGLYLLFFEPLPDETVQALDRDTKEHTAALAKIGWRRYKVSAPVVRCQGPLPHGSDLGSICHRILLRGVL